VHAIFLEERSAASEDKLRELKKADHLQSPYFKNAYIRTPLLTFKGISEINAMSAVVKEYLYAQQPPESNNNNLRGSNVSLNQLLSAKPAQPTGGKQRSPEDHYESYKGRDSQVSSGRKYQY
jgi:Cu/Ag efflux pump CusA